MTTATANNHAIDNAAAWYDTITDQLARLKVACQREADTYDTIREEILESPLEVQLEADEFLILLSTGGPALRIRGDLGRFNCPECCRMEWQDWGTPWTEYIEADSSVLDAWAAQFYFGD